MLNYTPYCTKNPLEVWRIFAVCRAALPAGPRRREARRQALGSTVV